MVGGEGRVEFVTDTNLQDNEWSSRSPHTSLLIACYKVERYLPDFLASLEAQTIDHRGYELIFIIDGCPERSEELVREWMTVTDYAVRVISKPNGGVASARNAGLDYARGDWVTHPDPDDWLERDYLAEIERARADFPAEPMYVGRVDLRDAGGAQKDHPLEFRFDRSGTNLVDLKEEPDRIQTLGGTVFMRRDIVERYALRFDPRLVQASDTDFLMRYFVRTGARYVLVPSALYEYRRREDESSIVVKQEKNLQRYRVVFGQTHRALLELVGDECPQWLANTLLYFSFWPFRRNRSADSSTYLVPQPELDEISDELIENLRRIGPERIGRFRVLDVPIDMRAAWLAAAESTLRHSPVEHLGYNDARDLRRVAFYSSDREPPDDLKVVEGQARILETKSRRVEYWGRTWVYQHVVHFHPARARGVKLGSSDGFEFEFDGEAFAAGTLRRKSGQEKPKPPSPQPGPVERAPRAQGRPGVLRRLELSLALRSAALSGRIRRYDGAVVFDLVDAPELVELYRVVANAGAELNAWAIAEEPLLRQLRGEHLPVLRYGGNGHFILMKRARVLVSGSPDERVPFAREVLERRWQYLYAPAADVGEHDYWLVNAKPIDLIAANDEREWTLFAADGGDYRFTPSEVVPLDGYREIISGIVTTGVGARVAHVLARIAG